MKISYEVLENEILTSLKKNKIWILSTSHNNHVTSRSMSIINEGLNIYFQTNKCYEKYTQMEHNPNISLCFNNISIEGTVEKLGDWNSIKNKTILDLYINSHKNSYEYYGNLEGQLVYKINPTIIKVWKYINNKPIREFLYVNNKIAKRLDFM